MSKFKANTRNEAMLMYADGLTLEEIGNKIGCSKMTIFQWKQANDPADWEMVKEAAKGERVIDSQMATSTKYVSTTMRGNETMFGVNFADGRIKGYPAGAGRPVRGPGLPLLGRLLGTGGLRFALQLVAELLRVVLGLERRAEHFDSRLDGLGLVEFLAIFRRVLLGFLISFQAALVLLVRAFLERVDRRRLDDFQRVVDPHDGVRVDLSLFLAPAF